MYTCFSKLTGSHHSFSSQRHDGSPAWEEAQDSINLFIHFHRVTSDSDVMLIPSIPSIWVPAQPSSVQFYWFFYGLQKTMVKIVFNIWRKKIGCDSTFSSSNGERQLRGRAHEGSKYTTRDPSTKFPKLVYLVTLCVRSMWETLSWLFKRGSPCFRRHNAYFCLTI